MLGQHEVLIRLAAGGAANVFLVRDTTAPPPGRLLALKVLLPSLAANDDFLNMFFTEARIAARLNHPNIVQITGFGQAEGIHCLAMEYVFGASLAQVLRASARARKPLTVGVLLRITALVCDALHYAHELKDEHNKPMGLVHRDVTPQNILVGFNGVPKLTDFGIAKATNRGWETQAGIVKGKFSYMSPEQALGKKIDRRSDIFCTGIVLWEALTGKELFKGTSPMEVIDAIREQPIVPPSKVVPGLSPIVDPIVMKALRRSPRARYQTAADMRSEIEELIDRAGVKIDSQTISKEFAEIFGETIVERAFALRAAMAGRAELDELARVLGASRLRDDHLPVIPGGASHPDPLGLFNETSVEEEDIAIDEPPPGAAQPARVEQAFTKAFQAIEIDIEEAVESSDLGEESAAPSESGEELVGFDVDEYQDEVSQSGQVAIEGWEDATRMMQPNDELLSLLSEQDATIGMVPQRFAERFGIRPNDPDDRSDGGGFEDENTIDSGEHRAVFDDTSPVRDAAVVAPGDFEAAPPTVPGPVAYRSVSPKKIQPAETVYDPRFHSSRSSLRPIPRAPSLDMVEAPTPRPELEYAEVPLAKPPPPPPPRKISSISSGAIDKSAVRLPLPAEDSADDLPAIPPAPLDDPGDEDSLRSGVSMPGAPVLRTNSGISSMPGAPAIRPPTNPAIASLSAEDSDPLVALGPAPSELSPEALRELVVKDPPRAPFPMSTTPEPVNPNTIRLKPGGLLLLGAVFIAIGAGLGILFVLLLM